GRGRGGDEDARLRAARGRQDDARTAAPARRRLVTHAAGGARRLRSRLRHRHTRGASADGGGREGNGAAGHRARPLAHDLLCDCRRWRAAGSAHRMVDRALIRVLITVVALSFVAGVAFAATPAPPSTPRSAFVSVSAPLVAITHARVIDGTGAPARADQTLIISDGKIRALGPS